jgi:hypothetical protein
MGFERVARPCWAVVGVWLLVLAEFTGEAVAADTAGVAPPALPQAPEASVHPFWDRTNILLFSGIAVFRGLDYASTRNFMARGREEILLPDDVVDNSAGFASWRPQPRRLRSGCLIGCTAVGTTRLSVGFRLPTSA